MGSSATHVSTKGSSLASLIKSTGLSLRKFSGLCNTSPATISLLINKAKWPKSDAAKTKLKKSIAAALVSFGSDPDDVRHALEIIGGKKMFTGLTRNTLKLFSLNTDPFNPTVIQDSSDLYKTLEHVSAVRRIKYAADAGEMLILTAPQGSGKSTVVNETEHQLTQQGSYTVVRIGMPETDRLRTDSVVNQLAAEFDIPFNIDRSVKTDRLRRALKKSHNTKTLCIIDNAHDLHYRTLICLKQLWDGMVFGHKHLLAIVLVCQDKINDKLKNPSLIEVNEHVSKHPMRGLVNAAEVQNYMDHKLRRLKGGWQRLFSPDAPDLIYEFEKKRTGDVDIKPRALNTILASCLEEAAAMLLGRNFADAITDDELTALHQKIKPVDAAIIRRVFQERNGNNS
jgi:type II secretory pathway predicted ATPase ExeA